MLSGEWLAEVPDRASARHLMQSAPACWSLAEFAGDDRLRSELEGAAEQAVVAASEKASQVTPFGRQRVLTAIVS